MIFQTPLVPTVVRVPDFKGFVDNNIRVDFEKLLAHRYTLANASTIRPVHSTNLIGSVKPEIGTTWGDIDAFVEIIRGFGGFFVQIPPNPTKSGAEKERTPISKSLKEIRNIFGKKI